MKKRWFLCWFGVSGLLLIPVFAFASGFAINEQGAKAVGMGGAFVAQANDPTAVYYNPAGIVQLEGTQVSAGIAIISPDATFKSRGTSGIGRSGQKTDLTHDQDTFYIPNTYITQQVNDRISFGLGTFVNFGLSTEWRSGWEGRFITGARKAEINTFSINPVMAYRPHERVSFAFGPVLQYFDFTLKNQTLVPLPPSTGAELSTKFEGDDWNWGWNVAMLVWLTEEVKFGASYRSQVTHRVNQGNLTFKPQAPTVIPGVNFFDTGFETKIKLPAVAYLGLAWEHGPFAVEFDVQWTEWSSFNSLEATFDSLVAGTPGITLEQDWKNTWAYRFGAQYSVTDYLDLRAGIIRDKGPISDKNLSPLLPSGDRWLYTIGCSGHYGSFSLDLAYNYLDDESRTFDNSKGDPPTGGALIGYTGRMTGRFEDIDAHIFAANLTYRF